MRQPLLASHVLLFLLVASAPGLAAEPLRWSMAPGQEFRFRLTQSAITSLDTPGEPNVTDVKQTLDVAWRVESIDDQGQATIAQNVLRVRVKLIAPGGGEHEIDTDKEDTTVGIAALTAPTFESLVEHDTTLTVSALGALQQVDAPEELLQALQQTTGMSALGSPEEVLADLVWPCLLLLPEEAIEEGDSWATRRDAPMSVIGKQRVVTTYTLRGTEEAEGKSIAIIEPSVAIENSAPSIAPVSVEMKIIESGGRLLFDRQAGRLVSGQSRQKVALTLTSGDAIQTGTVEQSVKLEPLGQQL